MTRADVRFCLEEEDPNVVIMMRALKKEGIHGKVVPLTLPYDPSEPCNAATALVALFAVDAVSQEAWHSTVGA